MTALTAFIYATALTAGLLLGDSGQRAAALLVALVVLARLAVRRHRPAVRLSPSPAGVAGALLPTAPPAPRPVQP
jgi:hypothetical protein